MGSANAAAIGRARAGAIVLLAMGLAACSTSAPPSGPAEQATRPPPDQRASGVIVTPTGVVAPMLSSFAGGWWVRTPCDNVTAVGGGTRIDRVDVVLDAGHGGAESGARSPDGEAEKVPNLAVARRVASRLEQMGISTALTRGSDSFMTLKTRAEIATALRPKAFVSIHHNAGTTEPSTVPGTEAYHQIASDDGRRLARSIYEEVFSTFSRYDVRWYNPNPGVKSRRGDDGDYYGVLRMSQGTVGVIIEAAFMSNEPEAKLVLRPDGQHAEADAITRGIVRWLRTDRTGVVLAEPNAPPDPAVPAEDAGACVDPPLG
ncbi:MAG: N-acetylmuramoyl-L-alanine amidase [Actinobacteria bacterium]|nr:N-acetylmuramoyl-L-alanine amidase [Actinomycetota bacterium]